MELMLRKVRSGTAQRHCDSLQSLDSDSALLHGLIKDRVRGGFDLKDSLASRSVTALMHALRGPQIGGQLALLSVGVWVQEDIADPRRLQLRPLANPDADPGRRAKRGPVGPVCFWGKA